MPDENTTLQKEPVTEEIAKFLKALIERVNQPKEIDAVYANNTLFEVSAWDLKIIFGQLDQHAPKTTIDWHTAVTIPWTQARVLEYYLRANAAFYEKKFGPINLPHQARPPAPVEPTEEQIKDDPQATELWQAYKKIYEEMFLKYTPQEKSMADLLTSLQKETPAQK
jgi:hypothetical protein